MRILTRPELEQVDDLKRCMAFHDQLIHSRLLTILGDQTLAFDNHVLVSPAPPCEDSHWQLRDQLGMTVTLIDVPDLIGCPVTNVGYFSYPGCAQSVIPYLQFLNRIQLCFFTDKANYMLRHDRLREDAWDTFPLFETPTHE